VVSDAAPVVVPLVGAVDLGLFVESDATVPWRPADEAGGELGDQGAWPEAAKAMPEDITATTPPVATSAWRPRRVDRAASISSPLAVV
jgi:hypothetical protein